MGVQTDTVGRWTWLRILTGGIVLFILLMRALADTGNINYLPSLLLIGTFTVPLAFCTYLYSKIKVPDVHWVTLLLCVVWGGVLGVVVAGQLEYATILHLRVLPTVAIGVIEELAKLIVPAYFLFSRKYHSELDGIVLGAAAGAGFAALESMGYGLVALLASGGNVTATIQVLFLRSLMAPAAHIAWTALISGALWQATRGNQAHGWRRLLFTYLGVVILHSVWDNAGSMTGLGVPALISLAWLVKRVRRSQKVVIPTVGL